MLLLLFLVLSCWLPLGLGMFRIREGPQDASFALGQLALLGQSAVALEDLGLNTTAHNKDAGVDAYPQSRVVSETLEEGRDGQVSVVPRRPKPAHLNVVCLDVLILFRIILEGTRITPESLASSPVVS